MIVVNFHELFDNKKLYNFLLDALYEEYGNQSISSKPESIYRDSFGNRVQLINELSDIYVIYDIENHYDKWKNELANQTESEKKLF